MYLTASEPKALPFWAFIRRRKLVARNRFNAAVATEAEHRVSEMAVAIAAQLPSKLTERADHLRAEVRALREERAKLSSGFIPLAVRLRGFRTDQSECGHYVLIEVNRRTGELRAARPDYRHILRYRNDTAYSGWYNRDSRYNDLAYNGCALGAPDWQKIDGDQNAVILLGEIYRYAGQHQVTNMDNKY